MRPHHIARPERTASSLNWPNAFHHRPHHGTANAGHTLHRDGFPRPTISFHNNTPHHATPPDETRPDTAAPRPTYLILPLRTHDIAPHHTASHDASLRFTAFNGGAQDSRAGNITAVPSLDKPNPSQLPTRPNPRANSTIPGKHDGTSHSTRLHSHDQPNRSQHHCRGGRHTTRPCFHWPDSPDTRPETAGGDMFRYSIATADPNPLLDPDPGHRASPLRDSTLPSSNPTQFATRQARSHTAPIPISIPIPIPHPPNNPTHFSKRHRTTRQGFPSTTRQGFASTTRRGVPSTTRFAPSRDTIGHARTLRHTRTAFARLAQRSSQERLGTGQDATVRNGTGQGTATGRLGQHRPPHNVTPRCPAGHGMVRQCFPSAHNRICHHARLAVGTASGRGPRRPGTAFPPSTQPDSANGMIWYSTPRCRAVPRDAILLSMEQPKPFPTITPRHTTPDQRDITRHVRPRTNPTRLKGRYNPFPLG
jgi:hypothetical protein